jgi:ABC-type sugar transport system permease subunit
VGDLVNTILAVAAIVAATVGLFVGANALADQAPKRFPLFATVSGALVGALVGFLANSGHWFLGGPLWPLGGAAIGALFGRFVWAVPERHRLFTTIKGVLAGGVAGLFIGGLLNLGEWFPGGAAWPATGAIVGAVAGSVVGFRVWGRRPVPADRGYRLQERMRPTIFLAPALIFLGVTLIVPTIRTLYLSLRSKRGEDYVGTKNYREIFGDDRIFNLDGVGHIVTSRLFLVGAVIALAALVIVVARGTQTRRGVDLSSPFPFVSLSTAAALVLLAAVGSLRGVIWNNVFWVVFVTGFSTVLGLAIAVLADRSRGESLAKSLIFMPMAISFVGASVIWRFVYAFTPGGKDQFGLLNAAWVGLGGEPQTWTQQQPWNTMLLIVIMIWIQTGFAMVVLSAAIKAVPTELTEAARVDGASEVQTFWRVTVPQIRPTLAVVVTTLVITVLKIYDIVKVMTNGEFGTNVIANVMFDESFINRDYGTGSALAVLLFISVVPLMIINMRRVRRGEQA